MSSYIQQLIERQERKKTTLVNMEVSGDPRSLGLVRRVLCACAVSTPLPASFLNDIELAVSEACTNVVKHAYKFDQTRKFSLSIQVSEECFLINVIYTDTEFIPETVPVPDLSTANEGGLGVFIIRNVMDNIHYTTSPETGTVTLRMVKFIRRTPLHGETP